MFMVIIVAAAIIIVLVRSSANRIALRMVFSVDPGVF
jgi:predicted anti-sigma-YlaC factor YlaD